MVASGGQVATGFAGSLLLFCLGAGCFCGDGESVSQAPRESKLPAGVSLSAFGTLAYDAEHVRFNVVMFNRSGSTVVADSMTFTLAEMPATDGKCRLGGQDVVQIPITSGSSTGWVIECPLDSDRLTPATRNPLTATAPWQWTLQGWVIVHATTETVTVPWVLHGSEVDLTHAGP
jgi:hypothetical protein